MTSGTRTSSGTSEGGQTAAGAAKALAKGFAGETRTILRASRGEERPGEGGGLHQTDLRRIGEMVDVLRRVLFPGFFDQETMTGASAELEKRLEAQCMQVRGILESELRSVSRYATHRRSSSGANGAESEGAFVERICDGFFESLPRVRELLSLDVQAAYDGDPAAEHTDEVVLCYPGLEATFAQRVAHELYNLGAPIIPRVICELAHSRTGIDIHPGARIGKSFFIDHGSGVTIGETSVIGDHVKIYQGVTLGARSFPKDERGRAIKGLKRHPTIGDRVTLYAGAVILGGDTVIGDDCVIAGGVFVTSSVPPGHVVQQPRADLILKRHASGGAGAVKSAPAGADSGTRQGEPDVGWLDAGAGI